MVEKNTGLPVNGKTRRIGKEGLLENPSLDSLHVSAIHNTLALLSEKERHGLRILIQLQTLIRKRKRLGEHFSGKGFRKEAEYLLDELYRLGLIKKIDKPFTSFGSVKLKTILNNLTSEKLKNVMDFKEARHNFETNELFNLPRLRALRIKTKLPRKMSDFFRRNRR